MIACSARSLKAAEVEKEAEACPLAFFPVASRLLADLPILDDLEA